MNPLAHDYDSSKGLGGAAADKLYEGRIIRSAIVALAVRCLVKTVMVSSIAITARCFKVIGEIRLASSQCFARIPELDSVHAPLGPHHFVWCPRLRGEIEHPSDANVLFPVDRLKGLQF